ncbi:hypothetical protein NPIL_140591 [Nephila pilipes]|uniref:Uncharacterized protein n=1 Tax=Nephila pilipes TaxID=299642 RepID=A0A8X6N059_NEPPI|nr:hypothetical protein NPIL_140591 [Nephila pilipes]
MGMVGGGGGALAPLLPPPHPGRMRRWVRNTSWSVENVESDRRWKSAIDRREEMVFTSLLPLQCHANEVRKGQSEWAQLRAGVDDRDIFYEGS